MSKTVEHDTQSSLSDVTGDDGLDAEWLRKRMGDSVGCMHRIVRHLASGGMGHVFLAEHVHLGMYAAVKLPRVVSDAARAGIAREARMLAQLQHPNIVSVLDTGHMADGRPFLLMEYVSGLELDAWLDGAGTMSPKRTVRVLKQVAAALDYLHAQNIVHADIKPSNILIDPRAHDFVKLVDFGIAYSADQAEGRRGVMGTPAYMAPEQARGEACGPAIDVYGIAALALELLTGKPPYDYGTAQGALTAILTQPPALPSTRGMNVPGLDQVFTKALHADPAQRYPIASDFVDALEAVLVTAEARKTTTKARAPRLVPAAPQRALSLAVVPAMAEISPARSLLARLCLRLADCFVPAT